MNSLTILLQSLILPLILTILIELGVWKSVQSIFKTYNYNYLWVAIISVNMATNPAFNVVSSILDPVRELFLLEFAFEILIILIEASILYLIYKKEFGKFLLLSTIINLFSYGIGLILFRPI